MPQGERIAVPQIGTNGGLDYMRYLKWAGLVLGVVLLVLSFINASWIAPRPLGKAKLVANHNVHPLQDYEAANDDDCAANVIEPVGDTIENTYRSAYQSTMNSANAIAIDSSRTADDRAVAFAGPALDCLTDGKGPVDTMTLAELKRLDIGYGYTADGGKSFPLRGKFVGAIPTIGEIAGPVRNYQLFFRISNDDAAEADALLAELERSGIKPDKYMTFMGPPKAIAALREKAPESWNIDTQAARKCTADYKLQGWIGMTPDSCKGETLFIPIDEQWKFAGWPNRAIARMDAVDGRILLTGPQRGSGGRLTGLTEIEQIPDIPQSFNGYVLIDDIVKIGPGLQK